MFAEVTCPHWLFLPISCSRLSKKSLLLLWKQFGSGACSSSELIQCGGFSLSPTQNRLWISLFKQLVLQKFLYSRTGWLWKTVLRPWKSFDWRLWWNRSECEPHDKIAKLIHWNLGKKFSFPVWDHVPEKVVQNEIRRLWDFNLHPDRPFE